MTDIRRHLPIILACIQNTLSLSPASPSQEIMDALTTLLPTSYGIGTGCLVNTQGLQSLPLDIIIYDKTIPGSQHLDNAHRYELRQALILITILSAPTITDLDAALNSIASAKVLHPTHALQAVTTTASASRTLKKFFPLGIVVFQHLIDDQKTHDHETLSLLLDDHIHCKIRSHFPNPLVVVEQTSVLSLTRFSQSIPVTPVAFASILPTALAPSQPKHHPYPCSGFSPLEAATYTHSPLGKQFDSFLKRTNFALLLSLSPSSYRAASTKIATTHTAE